MAKRKSKDPNYGGEPASMLSELPTPPRGTRVKPPPSRLKRFFSWIWKHRRKRSMQIGVGCSSLILLCAVCTVIGAIGQTLGILPDSAEMTQTQIARNLPNQAAAFNATRDTQLTATGEANAILHPVILISADTPTIAPIVIPTQTFTPMWTMAATLFLLPTNTTQPLTLAPTFTLAPTSAQAAVAPISPPQTWYTQGQLNLRSCATTTCDVVGQLQSGTALTVNGQTNGEAVSAGNAVWYQVAFNNGNAFVYSGLVGRSAPQLVVNTSAPVQQVSGGATCPGFQFTCSGGQMTCAQAQACLADGNRQLDENHNCHACDSQCP